MNLAGNRNRRRRCRRSRRQCLATDRNLYRLADPKTVRIGKLVQLRKLFERHAVVIGNLSGKLARLNRMDRVIQGVHRLTRDGRRYGNNRHNGRGRRLNRTGRLDRGRRRRLLRSDRDRSKRSRLGRGNWRRRFRSGLYRSRCRTDRRRRRLRRWRVRLFRRGEQGAARRNAGLIGAAALQEDGGNQQRTNRTE